MIGLLLAQDYFHFSAYSQLFELLKWHLVKKLTSRYYPLAAAQPRRNPLLSCALAQYPNRTRILGLIIGLDATIEDQYSSALDKFAQALLDFSSMRQRMSFAMRLAVINVFLYSLFSFVNLLIYMPTRILQNIENQVLSFLSRVPFARLGIVSQFLKLYSIKHRISVSPIVKHCCNIVHLHSQSIQCRLSGKISAEQSVVSPTRRLCPPPR